VDRLLAESPAAGTREASWFAIFAAFATLSCVNANAAVGITLTALNYFRLHRPKGFRADFEWQVLCLPFVLRHYPLLARAADPIFWFAGERKLSVPLRITTSENIYVVSLRGLLTSGSRFGCNDFVSMIM